MLCVDCWCCLHQRTGNLGAVNPSRAQAQRKKNMWTSTKSNLWLLLLSLVVAAISMAPVHAVFRDWNPSDFVYYTSIGDTSGSLSCPGGKVIYFGE